QFAGCNCHLIQNAHIIRVPPFLFCYKIPSHYILRFCKAFFASLSTLSLSLYAYSFEIPQGNFKFSNHLLFHPFPPYVISFLFSMLCMACVFSAFSLFIFGDCFLFFNSMRWLLPLFEIYI
ncbi:hypothetical protein VIGAN_01240300, partial [Vigna angularis var. angularis]